MRQLQVLGVSDDGTSLLLGPDPGGKATHRVPLDDRLRSAARGQLTAQGDGERAESALSPREIQARMRAGDTPEAIAKAAGVPVARVLPYAAPVEAERQRVVDDARGALVRRARGPATTKPLGELVDARLAEVNGLKADTVEWTARRRTDGAWLVELAYTARGKRSASWLWQPAGRELTALDSAASRLSVDDAAPAKGKGKQARPAKGATTKSTAAKPAGTKSSAAKPAAKRTATKAAAATKAASTKRAAAKRAATRSRVTPTSRTAGRAAAKRPALPQPGTPPRVAPEPVRAAPVAAQAPPEPSRSAARRPGPRPTVPSWSDVLLGVQPPPRDAAAARQRPPSRRRRKG